MKNNKQVSYPPLVFSVFKPTRITSYDVVRHFKRNLPFGFGKIGHFGTLDPFACGVLMVGISGAARLNDFIHDFLPKTYLAVGKLGVETPTGDYTSEILQKDDSLYLQKEIAQIPASFLTSRWKEKFIGKYFQSPHQYSAAKFEGRPLHEWAREGIEIKKDAVERSIFDIEVVKYQFPYLSFRVKVSSGTYVRTLFQDLCKDLGTIGTLISLVREKVGDVSFHHSLHKNKWPHNKNTEVMKLAVPIQNVLRFSQLILPDSTSLKFKNGAFLKQSDFQLLEGDKFFWLLDENKNLLGLGEKTNDGFIRPKINFQSLTSTDFQ